MLIIFWDLIKSIPALLALIKEIRAEVDKIGNDSTVKERLNKLREANKAKDVKALNDILNGK